MWTLNMPVDTSCDTCLSHSWWCLDGVWALSGLTWAGGGTRPAGRGQLLQDGATALGLGHGAPGRPEGQRPLIGRVPETEQK